MISRTLFGRKITINFKEANVPTIDTHSGRLVRVFRVPPSRSAHVPSKESEADWKVLMEKIKALKMEDVEMTIPSGKLKGKTEPICSKKHASSW